MKVYIDFDDVICETAKHITKLAKKLFGIDLPYREMQFFNLQRVYDLSDTEYNRLMQECHTAESLLSYEETPGASRVINKWVDEGHKVYVITGRPFDAYEPSRLWLDSHGLERVPLYTVDKYGREKSCQTYSYGLTLEQLYGMDFDFAVEDSPAAFEHVLHFKNCETAVFDRPWNRQEKLPNGHFKRCHDWQEIEEAFAELRRCTAKEGPENIKKTDFVRVRDHIRDIRVALRYSTAQNFTGRVIYDFTDAWLRYGTVRKLAKAQEILKAQGYGLKIWDAYRPVYAQFMLWKVYPDATFVADPTVGYSDHSRGNTLDVTVIDRDGNEISMPTEFDSFSPLADRDYRDVEDKESVVNAWMLQEAMTEAGFIPYVSEWWHFSDEEAYDVEKEFIPKDV